MHGDRSLVDRGLGVAWRRKHDLDVKDSGLVGREDDIDLVELRGRELVDG